MDAVILHPVDFNYDDRNWDDNRCHKDDNRCHKSMHVVENNRLNISSTLEPEDKVGIS